MSEEDLEVLERFYTAIFRETKEEHHPISVTQLVYECIRRGFYAAVVPEEIIESAGKIRTWIGKKLHETPIYPRSEIELEYKGVHGRIDEYDPKTCKLLEKKSTRRIPREPHEHHVRQMQYYRVLLEKNGMPVKEAAILYIDVDSATATAYRVDINGVSIEEVEKEMLERAETLKKALKLGILPPRKVSWTCFGYCPFFGWCFLDYIPPVPKEVIDKLGE